MDKYIYNGRKVRIAEDDLAKFPGAIPVEKPKAKPAPANKAKRQAKNKKAEAGGAK